MATESDAPRGQRGRDCTFSHREDGWCPDCLPPRVQPAQEVEQARKAAHDAFHAYSQSAPGAYSEAMFKATVAAIDALADLAKRLERQATVWRIANDISLKERDEARRLHDEHCRIDISSGQNVDKIACSTPWRPR